MSDEKMSDEEERARAWESFRRHAQEMADAWDRLPDWKKPEKAYAFWESLQAEKKAREEGSTNES